MGKLGVTVVSMETRKLNISTKEVPYIVVERWWNVFNSIYIYIYIYIYLFLLKSFIPFYMILHDTIFVIYGLFCGFLVPLTVEIIIEGKWRIFGEFLHVKFQKNFWTVRVNLTQAS